MKVKDILTRFDGEFYIYKDIRNKHGNIIDNECIASNSSIWRELNKYANCEIKEITAGNFFLNIYLK